MDGFDLSRLSAPVGAGRRATNREDDVTLVQRVLKEATAITADTKLDPGLVDGDCGVGTEGAISHLQRRLGSRRPDVRIDPAGLTARRLAALLRMAEVEVTSPFDTPSGWAFAGAGAGMRAFGARRAKGRGHAGIDFYYPDYTPVRAIADGVVIRGPYPFYCETLAVEIDHGAFVARYGELAPESRPFVREGLRVERGHQLGRVGILMDNRRRLRVPSMMLHFEAYDKTATGPLTVGRWASAVDGFTGRRFYRRRDVVDPTWLGLRALGNATGPLPPTS